jgi:hypothetical protein
MANIALFFLIANAMFAGALLSWDDRWFLVPLLSALWIGFKLSQFINSMIEE